MYSKNFPDFHRFGTLPFLRPLLSVAQKVIYQAKEQEELKLTSAAERRVDARARALLEF